MRKLLGTLAIVVYMTTMASTQTTTFTFECFCGYVTGDTCDVCDDATLQSRLFKGMIVYRNGNMYRLIDAPYIVMFRDSTAIIQELIYPNPERLIIGINGTNFTTIEQFQDSLKCPCSGNLQSLYYAGPGINIYNDTIASIPQQIDTFQIFSGAQDTLKISLTRDSVPAWYVVLPGGAGGESWTIDGDAGDTELINNQTVLFAGGGINSTNYDAGSNTLTITGTESDGDPNNEIQTLNNASTSTTHTTTLSNSGGSTQFAEGTGIGLATTGTALDGILTITNTGDLSTTNEAWTIDGDAGATELINSQTVLFAGGGINSTNYDAGSNTLTITGTEIDGSVTNEAWTIDADDADTELISSQTVKFEGAGIVSTDYVPGTNTLIITATEVDGSVTNELQTYGHGGTTDYTNTLSDGGGSFTLQSTGIIDISHSGGVVTFDATEVDGSVTNELQTLDNASTSTTHTTTLSNSGGSTQFAEGTGIGLATTGTALDGVVTITNTGDLSTTNEAWTIDATGGDTEVISSQTVLFVGAGINSSSYDSGTNTLTITGTEVDGSVTNEAWTIDGDAGATELINSQTVLFAGGGINSTNYDAGSNTLTITGTESDGDPNNEIQTLSAGGVDPSMTLNLSVGGGTVTLTEGTNIDLDRTGNTITINSTATGTVDGAENGLNVVSNKVRLGGTLIVPTSINQTGTDVLRFYGAGKFSVSSWTGFGIDPNNAKIGFSGLEVAPNNTSTPGINGIVEFIPNNSSGGTQSNTLAIGGYVTDSHGAWIQSRSGSNPGFEYPLSMQPNGGVLSVGRRHDLNVPDAVVTIAGLGLTGSTASGSVLHLEHSEGHGNVPLTFGAGTDIVDAEIMWRETDDAFRIINRSNTGDISSIRFAFGSSTGDMAALVRSSDPVVDVRFAVGEGDPANIHSTIQSAGSYAGRVLTTVGSFTLTESNWTVIYTSTSTVTWTLPNPADCPGREYYLCSRNTGTVNIGGYSVSKGAGGNFTSVSSGQWAHIWSDGSGWTGYKITSE